MEGLSCWRFLEQFWEKKFQETQKDKKTKTNKIAIIYRFFFILWWKEIELKDANLEFSKKKVRIPRHKFKIAIC